MSSGLPLKAIHLSTAVVLHLTAAALLAAKGIYFPDPLKATAGIHFMNVLKGLGKLAGMLGGPKVRKALGALGPKGQVRKVQLSGSGFSVAPSSTPAAPATAPPLR